MRYLDLECGQQRAAIGHYATLGVSTEATIDPEIVGSLLEIDALDPLTVM